MSDENQATPEMSTAEAVAPQAPAPPAAPNVITMTPEEFEAKLNERAAQTRRALEAKAQKQAEPPKPKTQDSPAGLSPDDVQSMIARNRAFDRAVGDKFNAEQVAILETLLAVEKPLTSDISEWVSRKVKAFGTNTAAPTVAQTTVPAPPAPTASAVPSTPAPSHAAPAATNPLAPPQSVLDWSKDTMEAWLNSKGASSNNPFSTAYRKAAREMRERFLADGSRTRIIAPK